MIVSDEAVKVSHRFTNERKTRTTEQNYHSKLGYHLASSLYVSVKMRDYPVMAIPTKAVSSRTWLNHLGAQNQSRLAFFDPRKMMLQDGLITTYVSTLVENQHQASVDYIIFRIQVSKKSIHGQQAALSLLQAGYHLQILSASHSLSLEGSLEYGPNTPLRRAYDVQAYFQYGKQVTIETHQVYQAYLFATQRLDMAIPSAQQHMNLTNFDTTDIVLNVDGDAIPYRKCPRSTATVWWETDPHGTNRTSGNNGTSSMAAWGLGTHCLVGTVPKRLWFSGTSLNTSDLVCFDCTDVNRRRELSPRHDCLG